MHARKRKDYPMDFFEDIRQQVLAMLPLKPQEATALAAMDAHALLTLYLNWRARFIPVRPRTVHKAAALSVNPLASDPAYKPALEQIISSIEAGDDLTRYISKGITHIYHMPSGRHLDLLLNDWGIHHLHLSTTVEPDGFVRRTKPLLVAAFRQDDAYLIDILPHGAWTKESMIRTIVQEWPNAGLVTRLGGGIGLEFPISEQQRAGLRKVHIMPSVEIDGAVYVASGGVMLSGVSSQHARASNSLLRQARQIEEEIKQSPEIITYPLKNAGITPPTQLGLHFMFRTDGRYVIVEKNTNTLMSWPTLNDGLPYVSVLCSLARKRSVYD